MRDTAYWKNLYKERRERGLCTRCGKPRDSSFITCASCRQRQQRPKQYWKEHYSKRKENGQCVTCGQRNTSSYAVCQKCRDKRNSDRIKVLQHYGGYCNCCGENIEAFLELDHIENDGNEHRKELGISGGNVFYRWIVNNSFPSGFQILCSNCNKAKHINGGICPHQEQLSTLLALKQLDGTEL